MRIWITTLLLISLLTVSSQTSKAFAQAKPGLTLSTAAFEDGGIIPDKYTAAAPGPPCSPELAWTNVPAGTVSFVLMLHDPDTSVNKTATEILHWMAFNLPASSRGLAECVAGKVQLPDGTIQGRNYSGTIGYIGMGAPAPGPYHHYTFELFALDTKLSLAPGSPQEEVLQAMAGHILDKGVLVGRFHLP
jgi:Raf kinase inhibitor-like YbhB/YbcL family protein